MSLSYDEYKITFFFFLVVVYLSEHDICINLCNFFILCSFRAAYLVVLKICKLLLTTVGKCIVQVEADSVHCHGSPGSLSPSSPSSVILTGRASVLQQALSHIPNPSSEFMLRNVSSRLAQLLHDQVCII